jgi:hypothetical protein
MEVRDGESVGFSRRCDEKESRPSLEEKGGMKAKKEGHGVPRPTG